MLAFLGLAAAVWPMLCTSPGLSWNAPRLASSFALARGLGLYQSPGDGAQLGWFYPPGFAIWYLPVTFFHQPTAIIVLAAALNFATVAAPLFWLSRLASGSVGAAFAGMMTGLALLLAHGSTSLSFYWIHVDVVCLAFGFCAGGAVWWYALVSSGRWLHVAALATVGAVFTKQLAIVLPLACGGWLVASRGWRDAVRYMGWCLFYALLAAATCVLIWGLSATTSSILLVLAHTPFGGTWAMFWHHAAVVLVGLPIWMLVALLLHRHHMSSRSAPSLGVLLGVIALAHLPLGITTALKVGGGLNSFHTLPYVAALLAVEVARRWDSLADPAKQCRFRLLAAMLWCGGILLGHAHAVQNQVVWRVSRTQDEQLATAHAHRGAVYFPWNPLITILSENKLLPFDNALQSLEFAHMAPPADAIRAAVPRHALLVFPEPCQSQFVLGYLYPPPAASDERAESGGVGRQPR